MKSNCLISYFCCTEGPNHKLMPSKDPRVNESVMMMMMMAPDEGGMIQKSTDST